MHVESVECYWEWTSLTHQQTDSQIILHFPRMSMMPHKFLSYLRVTFDTEAAHLMAWHSLKANRPDKRLC